MIDTFLNLKNDKLRGAVDTWLSQHGGMLIGEVVYLALNALNRGDLAGGTFDHVVVDEYQDLTAAEQQMDISLNGNGIAKARAKSVRPAKLLTALTLLKAEKPTTVKVVGKKSPN